jgi:hypothetical protein
MAKCKRCGKGGLFHKVNEQGLCKDCERIVALEVYEQRLRKSIEQSKVAYTKAQSAYAEINEKKQAIYNAIVEKAQKDALSAITGRIDEKNVELEAIAQKVEEHKNQLKQLIEEQGKSQKTITTNATKLFKVQTLFKSVQYSAKRYFDAESVTRDILNESTIEADEALSTTIKLKFNLMDVRELRKRYNQNNKLIQELLVKYQTRYTTKTNIAIYKLMVIALEAELQIYCTI